MSAGQFRLIWPHRADLIWSAVLDAMSVTQTSPHCRLVVFVLGRVRRTLAVEELHLAFLLAGLPKEIRAETLVGHLIRDLSQKINVVAVVENEEEQEDDGDERIGAEKETVLG